MTSKTEITYTSTKSWLLATINDFLEECPEMSPETFGWKSVKDTTLVERLRNGGDVRTLKLDMIIAFIHNIRRSKNGEAKENRSQESRSSNGTGLSGETEGCSSGS